jgi:hypothetical protein
MVKKNVKERGYAGGFQASKDLHALRKWKYGKKQVESSG